MPAQAQACLAVLPGSAAAAAERDAIAGVLRLRALSVELPPLQFRQARRTGQALKPCSSARRAALPLARAHGARMRPPLLLHGEHLLAAASPGGRSATDVCR